MGDGSTRRLWCTFGPQQIDIDPFSIPGALASHRIGRSIIESIEASLKPPLQPNRSKNHRSLASNQIVQRIMEALSRTESCLDARYRKDQVFRLQYNCRLLILLDFSSTIMQCAMWTLICCSRFLTLKPDHQTAHFPFCGTGTHAVRGMGLDTLSLATAHTT